MILPADPFRVVYPRRDDGFTLIELMVVVLIISILLAVAVPSYLGARERALDRKAQTYVRNGYTIESAHYSDGEQYTDAPSDLERIDTAIQFTQSLASLAPRSPVVYVRVSTTISPSDTVILGARGARVCFWLRRVASRDVGYAENDCSGEPGVFGASW